MSSADQSRCKATVLASVLDMTCLSAREFHAPVAVTVLATCESVHGDQDITNRCLHVNMVPCKETGWKERRYHSAGRPGRAVFRLGGRAGLLSHAGEAGDAGGLIPAGRARDAGTRRRWGEGATFDQRCTASPAMFVYFSFVRAVDRQRRGGKGFRPRRRRDADSRRIAGCGGDGVIDAGFSAHRHRAAPSRRIRIMPSANTKRSNFPGLAVLIIGASMLVAFAALWHGPSRTAAAQDAYSNADLAEHTATPTSAGSATATLSPTPTTSPTPEPPPPTDLDMKVVEDVVYVSFSPSQTDGNLQHFHQIQISRAATQKEEFLHHGFYMTQASRTPIKDLTAGWWYRARMRRCETEKAVNCGYWSLPVVSHFPTIVKTKCGPALALGASQAVDLTPDDPSKDFKYPKLNIAWNEIFVRYEAAIGEGLSPENAIARAWQGWGAPRDEYIISEPDSKFPQHRILGWIRFVHSSNFNQKTPTQWLRDFLASQGISADVRDVFGEFHYDPDDVSGIDNIMLPFTLAGPLSELPEVKSLHLVHNAPVYLE